MCSWGTRNNPEQRCMSTSNPQKTDSLNPESPSKAALCSVYHTHTQTAVLPYCYFSKWIHLLQACGRCITLSACPEFIISLSSASGSYWGIVTVFWQFETHFSIQWVYGVWEREVQNYWVFLQWRWVKNNCVVFWTEIQFWLFFAEIAKAEMKKGN